MNRELKIPVLCIALLACEDRVGTLAGTLELPARIDFGDVTIGARRIRSFEIANHGADSVRVRSLLADGPQFRASWLGGSVNAGESLEIELEFEPTAVTEDRVSDVLRLDTDAGGARSS